MSIVKVCYYEDLYRMVQSAKCVLFCTNTVLAPWCVFSRVCHLLGVYESRSLLKNIFIFILSVENN